MSGSIVRRLRDALVGFALSLACLAAVAQNGAPPPGTACVVTAGNRNAPLAADGSYTVFGIPGNLGAIRARATCADGSIGQSSVGFTNPNEEATIVLGPIEWGRIDPVPIAATLSAPTRYLSTGQTAQLAMTAVGADGTARDVTPRSAGTVYSVSSAFLASVTDDGLVRIYPQFAPGSSARVVASATSEGSVSSTYMFVLGPRGRLTGKVVRADGVTTVAAAQVSVLRLQPMEQAGTAVTDMSGRFELADVNAGSFLVTAIDPVTGDRALTGARIETEGQVEDVTLKLNGLGQVDVRVVDAADANVTGAEVAYTALGAQRDVRTLITNAQGIASFIGVPAGDFTVSTRDPATRLVGTAVATLAVGQTLPLTLRLQPVGQIEGRVLDTDATTLRPGVQVRILSRERGLITQAVVGADAAFRFDTLPISDGPFTLDAFVDGRLRARVPGIVISNPNDTERHDIVLGAVGTVTGRVVDPAGQTFANARVTMQSQVGLRLSFDALTNAAGRFVLPAVPVGAFKLTAVTPQGRAGSAQDSVDVDGETVTTDVTLADNTLVGTVYERDGTTPVGAGVEVYLAPRAFGRPYTYAGMNGIARTTTAADGSYGFSVTQADSYYVQAERTLDRGRSEVVLINLDPAQPLRADVKFLAKGRVYGVVRDSTGVAQGDVPVVVRTQGAFWAERATRTDAQGNYSLDGVFAGDVVVAATNETTRLAGVNTDRLDAEGQNVRVDVTLAATGTVSGRVLRRDGGVVPGAVRIDAKRNGMAFASFEVPSGAAYQLDLVPLGDIEVTAEELVTGDKGAATTRLVSAGDARTLDVRLVGQGQLRVRTLDAQQQPVAGARVTVSTTLPFRSSQETTTDADGRATFARVFAGDYTIAATKEAPLGALSGSASGTLLPGADEAVNVPMTGRSIGRVHGKVLRPDGVTPVGAGMVVRMLPEPFPDAYVTRTDANGDYAFEAVESGSYTIDVLKFYTPGACPARDRVRGRGNATVDETGGDALANVQIIGEGRITGTVKNAQGTALAGIEVRVTNPDPIYGANVTCSIRTTYDRITDAQGAFEIADAPPGDFSVTAENATRTLRAEATGRIRFDGDVAPVPIVLVDSAVTMPLTLHDANGFPFDVTGNGAIGTGHNNVFGAAAPDNAAMRLDIVKDGVAVPFTNGNGTIGRLAPNGQEVALDDATPSGLTVVRRVYTPRAGYFTRWIDELRNDTAQPITVSVRVRSHHRAANSNPRIVDSSDGDQILSVLNPAAPDRWVVVDDQIDADPFDNNSSIAATGHLFDGAGAATRVGVATYDLIGQTGRLTYEWRDVTVAPGETAAFLHFVMHQIDRRAAREAALRLAQLPPEAIDDLTTAERRAIRNFVVPDASALEPLPNLETGVIEGRVLSGDNSTPIADARVSLRSKHALFGRERIATSGSDGSFRFRSRLDGTAQNAVVPVFGFELRATHPRSAAQTPLTPGEFDAGSTTEVQDLVFINSGDVAGQVRRHNEAPVADARVDLCRIDDPTICNDAPPRPVNWAVSGSAGEYRLTANRPNDYFLFARKTHPQNAGNGRDLYGRATTTVLAGRTTPTDIHLEPTGSIAGKVYAGGTPVADAQVYLEAGNGTVLRGARTDTAGFYRLADVPVGDFVVRAIDPISQAGAFAPATVEESEETPLDLHLRASRGVNVRVNYARGTPAASSQVQAGSYYENTDTNGAARFQLPVGTWTFRASHPDNGSPTLSGVTEATIVEGGADPLVTVTLQPAGSVGGTITRPDGTTLAGGFPYTIRQIRGVIAGHRSGSTNATGSYLVAGLPIGGYLITAYDAQQDRFAEAEFDVTTDGEVVPVNLLLLENRIALPAPLNDANRFLFDVQRSGALATGSGIYENGGLALSVNGVDYAGDSSARIEASRRQFAITQPAPMAGLVVTRRIYVPRGAYFARYLEVFDNPTAAPISVDVALTSRYVGGGVYATSSGDATATTADRWLIIDDTVDADPLTVADQQAVSAHVFAATTSAGPPDAVEVVTNAGKPRLTERWNALTVPAGGRVTLMHFAVQQIHRDGARAAVERLVALPPEALADLTAEEAATIRNFDVPADLASTVEPLPSLTGSVRGVAWEDDGRTPVRGARITVQSNHPLFNRVWGKVPDPVEGCPSGTSVASLRSASTPPGGTPAPPPLGSWSLQGQLTAADSIALPEGSELRVTAQESMPCFGIASGHPLTSYPSRVATLAASGTQDVLFDTTVVGQNVVGDLNFSITRGRMYRSIDNPDAFFRPVYVPIAVDGTFEFPGVPAGTYDLLFDTPAPNARPGDQGLRGSYKSQPVELGTNNIAVTINLQPTGTIVGTVYTANGELSRNARLVLIGAAEGQVYDHCATGCTPEALDLHKGKTRVEREVVTDSLGVYRFVAVPAGAYTLDVTDPISGGRRVLTFDLPAGIVPRNESVELLPVGAADVIVRTATGQPVVDAIVYLTAQGPEQPVDRTGADGRLTVPNIPRGPYTLRVKHPRYPNLPMMDRRVSGTIEAGGERDAVTIDLVPAAKIELAVVDGDNGAAPVPGATVTVIDAGGTRSVGTTNAQGRLDIDPVAGAYTLRARARIGNIDKEESTAGTLAPADDATTKSATIDLRSTLVPLPQEIRDANRMGYRIEADGAASAQMPRLSLSGTAFAGAASGLAQLGRREIAIAQTAPVAGLDVTRRVFVPRNGYFARYLDILENRTAAPINVDVRLAAPTPASNNWILVDTQNGDTTIDNGGADPDRWFTVSRQYAYPWTMLASGAGGALAPPLLGYAYDPDVDAWVASATWTGVTVPAGARVALLHFVVQQFDVAGSRASAQRLAQLPPEALDGIDASLAGAIANFVVPADGSSALEPLPSLEGRVSGRLFDSDGTPLAKVAPMTVRSGNPLFGNTWTFASNAQGEYALIGELRDDGQSVAVPVDAPLTIGARHPHGPATASAVASFPTGASAVVQDLTFEGGVATGTVGTAFRYPPPFMGSVRALNGATQVGFVDLAADGTYRFGGLPAGTYTFEAQFTIAGGTALTGVLASANVVAGSATNLPIALTPNGAVAGRLLAATGAGMANEQVQLSSQDLHRTAATDAQGEFLLPAVPAGTHRLFVVDPRTGAEVAANVSVSANQTTTQNLQLQGLGTVTITTRYARNAIAPGVPLKATAPSIQGERALGPSGADGRLVVQLPVGPYTILAQHPASGGVSQTPGVVASDGELSERPVILPASANLRARVIDASAANAPIVGATVSYRVVGAPTWSFGVVTGADGRAAFPDRSAASYELRATAPDGRIAFANATLDASVDGGNLDVDIAVTGGFEVIGTLDFANERHLYGIAANAGEALAVAISAATVGPVPDSCRIRAEVYSPDRNLLARGYGYGAAQGFSQVNEFGDLRNVAAGSSGSYTVALSMVDAFCTSGGYRLGATRNAAPAAIGGYEPGGTIHGRLFMPDRATTVAGATVRLYQSQVPGLYVETTTAADGSYAFAHVPAGVFRLTTLPLAGSSVSVLVNGRLNDVAVPLERDLVIPSRTVLDIRAVNVDGSAFAQNVGVQVVGDNTQMSTSSDDNGRLQYEYIGATRARVTLLHHETGVSGDAYVEPADGQTVDVPVVLAAAGVHGRVLDAAGAGIENVPVNIVRPDNAQTLASGGTDASGAFTFANLPAGAIVDVRAYDTETYVGVRETVTLVANQTVERDVHLVRGSLRGKVTNAWGAAVRGATVRVDYVYDDASGATTSRTGETDADGDYVVPILPQARELRVVAERVIGSTNYASPVATLVLIAGSPDQTRNFTLDFDGGIVDVSVRLAGGATPPGSCQLHLAGTGGYDETVYAGDCTDTFYRVPAGPATLSGSFQWWPGGGARPGAKGSGGVTIPFGPIAITVPAAARVSANAVLSLVNGTVRYADDTAVAHPSISIVDADGRSVVGESGQDGSYLSIGVIPGTFTVHAQDDASGLAVSQTGTLADPAVPVTVPLVLPPHGSVAGVVYDVNNVPVASASVYATSSALALDRYAQTDAVGAYRFDYLAIGDIALAAVDTATNNIATGTTTLASQGAHEAVDLHFPVPGAVEGTIRRADGNPAADACVVMWLLGTAPGYGDISASTIADAAGRYAFATVVPGPLAIHASDCVDTANGVGTINVTPGPAVTLDVQFGNALKTPVALVDDVSGYEFSVAGDARINASRAITFDHAVFYEDSLGLSIGAMALPYQPAARVVAGGRELVYETVLASGLRVTRRVFVPASGGYARTLVTLANPGAGSIAFALGVRGRHADDAAVLAVAPASVGGTYAMQGPVTVDAYAAGVAAYVFGSAAADLPDRYGFTNGMAPFDWSWNVTVPAGESASYLVYTVVREPGQATAAQAQAASLAAMTQAGMFDGLSPADKSSVKNFTVPN
jgi:hypothetical protein